MSDDQRQDRYRAAIGVAETAVEGMSDDALRQLAFAAVLRDVLGDQQYHESQARVPVVSKELSLPGTMDDTLLPGHSDDPMDRIAQHLSIDPALANSVLEMWDERPRLALPSSRLPSARVRATQEIALVLCGAYEALGLDPPDTGVVRQECERYDRYDGANFARSLGAMEGKLTPKGPPRAKKKALIISVPGREEAATVLQRWAGEGSGS